MTRLFALPLRTKAPCYSTPCYSAPCWIGITTLIVSVFGTCFSGPATAQREPTPVQSAQTEPASVEATALSAQKEPTPAQKEPTPAGANPQKQPPLSERVLSYEFGFQSTLIDQNLFKFRSLYQGANSLLARNENEKTDTYTLYLGKRFNQRFEVYVDPEMARGNGLSTALGVAGFPNGDVIRNPQLSMDPYLARYIARWTISTGHGVEEVPPGENQIPGNRPTHRLVITAGKMGTNDIFDTNSYANSTRTQFMNWALINSAAYDYAADTRGYTQGIAAEWIQPTWALRVGRFQMPKVANGLDLQENLTHFHGDQVELELHPRLGRMKAPAIVRTLGFINTAHMGNYRDALALAQQTGTTPDITAVGRNNAIKVGFVINVEQALADEGETGLFGRYGWNDGATESFVYTECDRSFSLGMQLSGRRWHRPKDRLAIAFVQNDLSAAHRDYLTAGGVGFIIGDGKLRYGPEQIVETYYNVQLTRTLMVSLDYQFINNPAYNRDRGPASVLSLRTHLEF